MNVCVFCGASPGVSPQFVAAAGELGTALAEAGIGVVYGAGGSGVMGALADAALAAGGRVVGVIPRSLLDVEHGREDLTELHVVATMHERKALMHQLSQGFITLPGGLGTLEELFEVLTWRQLGIHDKPLVLFDVDGYYAPLATLLDHAVDNGFVRAPDRDLLAVVDTALEAVARVTHSP